MADLSGIVFASALAVVAERQRQIETFGHDADQDDNRPRCHLLKAAHVRLLDAADLVSGRPDQSELLRARTKTVQAAALCLAEIDRIDRQIRNATVGERSAPYEIDECEVPF